MNNGWEVIRLGEILTERQEEPPPEMIANGNIQIIAKIGFNEGQVHLRPNSNTKTKMILIRPGDLVLSGINATKGAIAIYDEKERAPIAATIHYSAYIVNKNRVDYRYLWQFLRSNVFRGILGNSLPNGIKAELKAKRFLPIKIPLPPLAEQKRIVKRIEELTSRVEEACRLRIEVKSEMGTIMEKLINSLLLKFGNEFSPLQYYLIGKPRNGWSPPKDSYTNEGEISAPVLILSAVTGFNFDSSKVKWTRAKTEGGAHYWLSPGELLITRSNTPELVGHSAIYNGTPPQCICPDLIMKMTIDPVKADTRFIHYWLQTAMVRNYIAMHASGTSGTMKKISQGHVQNIPILKVPIDDQRKIVTYFDKLRIKIKELDAQQNETATKLAAFTPALLAKAFRGAL